MYTNIKHQRGNSISSYVCLVVINSLFFWLVLNLQNMSLVYCICR